MKYIKMLPKVQQSNMKNPPKVR